jgi:hypothetical protein
MRLVKPAPREEDPFPLLGSLFETPRLRERLQTICSLYHHSRDARAREALLDRMEQLTLELAHLLAVELLESGWRP